VLQQHSADKETSTVHFMGGHFLTFTTTTGTCVQPFFLIYWASQFVLLPDRAYKEVAVYCQLSYRQGGSANDTIVWTYHLNTASGLSPEITSNGLQACTSIP
jgi:hypothetical protein